MTRTSALRKRWSVEPGRTILQRVHDWFFTLQMPQHGQRIETLRDLLKELPFADDVPDQRDLRGASLSGGVGDLDFTGFDFSYARLQINIARSTLVSVRFDSADLLGMLLADCSQSSFRGTTLRGAFMKGAQAHHCCFDNAMLQHVNLEGADLRNSSFRNARLRGVNLVRANVIGCDFRHAHIEECPFQEVTINETTDFRGASLVRLLDSDLRDNSGSLVARASDWRQGLHDGTTVYRSWR